MEQQQIILITGASSGFGKMSAQMLAKRGHIVYGTSRKQTDNTGNVMMLAVDVTDPSSIEKAVSHIYSKHERIDVLINNAGMGIGGALELATKEEVAQQMDTNFFGVVNMCNAVLPYMRKARKGKIINLSSIAGIMAVPYQGFYSASKFAIEGYSEALSLELHPFHIKVCLVEPGDFKTGFTANRKNSTATLNSTDYGAQFTNTLSLIEKAENQGSDPTLLAKAICRIVEKRNPAFRTLVGPWDQVLFARLKAYLPDRLIQYTLRSFYQIK